jgi:holo-[acyl-carrier protein] synthase
MLGVDIVSNKRIERSLNRFGERFLKRIYTERELEYCYSYKDFVPCLAARWAAKEAVIKAFFPLTGIVLKFNQIEIIGRKGFPAKVVLPSKFSQLLEERNLQLVVSLSHEKEYSVAVAQIIRKDILLNGVS